MPNVCPPDNDPPPCANEFAPAPTASRGPKIKQTNKINWAEEYSSPKKADVYIKLVNSKSRSPIKYERGRKNKAGNYIYSLLKNDIAVINRYSGEIEVVKIFTDAKRKVSNFKTMLLHVP